MKLLLTIFFSFSICISFSQTIKQLKTEVIKLAADKELANATISFYAYDVDSNKTITGLNANKSLVPASTLKLITTATVLEMYGPNHTLNTNIHYTGEIDTNCVLNGDIIIKGAGDPALGSHRYKKHYQNFISNWANSIKNFGIDSVNGRVIADASIFSYEQIPATWIWADLGNYYGAGANGLSIYENFYQLEFSSGKIGDSAQVTCIYPYIPNMEINNQVKSMNTKKDKSYIFGAPYQQKRIIKGGIPAKKNLFYVKGSIPDPAYLAAFELSMELKQLSINCKLPCATYQQLNTKPEKITRNIITITKSPRLKSLIKQTNTYSINLYAEHFNNLIGLKKYKSGDANSGTTATINFWEGKSINTSGMYINDGSGLSRFNAVSAKHLVHVLKYMYNSKNYKYFEKSLPIAGKTGTLRNIGKGTAAQGKVKAKSGYMTRVRSYAGYVTTKNNRKIAFAIIVNNYNCSAYSMKKKLEQIIIKLAQINE